ncbi:hypothetical protein GOEFS_059_00200 [Gordonia effusa NBRC 100432]|uniref:Uncharacterized protein n=1 Tax=Gordonia effusa NBRC 100432 TaxID=1077974 RepID=H0R0I5_9ACTN|nr:hypothetical protein [Gordonia effusa]GAB18586.1 hypothetical protein GOEFS_059_00200 [Gordonia effusa NBRC 100432]
MGGAGATSGNSHGANGTLTIFGSSGTEYLRSVRGAGGYERDDGFIEPSAATPGNGGASGFVITGDTTSYALSAEDGAPSAFAAGGRRGASNGDGLAGDNAPAGSPSGGGGGGGGQYATGWFASGGVGGPGGFPGGGGGAGAIKNGGPGANGTLLITIYDE